MSRDSEAARWFARMRGPDAERARPEFEAWRRDGANAAAYARAEADWEFAGMLSPARIKARGRRDRFARPALRWGIATLAGLGLALALALNWPGPADRQSAALAQAQRPNAALRLADGSEVRLMDGARIEIRFAAAQRRVTLLGGRARFSVAHDAARPFVVTAGGSETTALGTVFEVDLRTGRPRVRLVAGSVEVRATGTTSAVRLRPGESAEIDGRVPHRLAPKDSTPTATMIDAADLPLAAVIERANRANAVPIRLADPALGALRLSGRFDIADSAALARKLAAALDLAVREGGDGFVLSRAPEKTGG